MSQDKVTVNIELSPDVYSIIQDTAVEDKASFGETLDRIITGWDYYQTNEAWEDKPNLTELDALGSKIEQVDRLADEVILKLKQARQGVKTE